MDQDISLAGHWWTRCKQVERERDVLLWLYHEQAYRNFLDPYLW